MKPILLNPGPVTLSNGVRRAAVSADLCHREPEFFDLQNRVRSGLLEVYGIDPSEWSAVMLGGSGTTALEAMVSSLIPEGARVLVIENGVYGERLTQLARIHDLTPERAHFEWTAAWNLGEISRSLETGSFSHVLAVHHETTTGRLNSVDQLAELCERHGCDLLLDSVSAFGAEALPHASPALVACSATANKCLHGITGLCFVICRNESLGAKREPRSLTLHLPLWAEHQARRSTPFTPSVNAMLALDRALWELKQQGGWASRQARYRDLAGRIAAALDRLGLEPLLPQGASSCVLRAYRLPGGVSYQGVHDGLKERGFVIYSGQGSLAQSIFRISTMGAIDDEAADRFMGALQVVFGA